MPTNSLSKYQILFLHLAFWAFVLALPFLLQASAPPPRPANMPPPTTNITITGLFEIFALINIPFFYVNSEILIPKVLRKRGFWTYVVSIIFLVVAVFSLHALVKELFFPTQNVPRLGYTFQLLFFLAISSSYRLITDNWQDQQKTKERENERLKSELSFLRSQISPHFIFNVLNSIVSLSRRKPERVEPVVVKLSELMRYMLYESDDAKIPIVRESEYLKAYIELQHLRFGDDIKIHFEVENLDNTLSIEPMLLIPFVENAFKHGVGMIVNPTIDIDLKTEKNRLIFEIKNKVNRQFNEIKDSASGIGLNNVKRRLELLYPDNHRLIINDGTEFYVVHLEIG